MQRSRRDRATLEQAEPVATGGVEQAATTTGLVAAAGPIPAVAGSSGGALQLSVSDRAYGSPLEIEDEFQVLYRGSQEPPEQVFRQGFVSRAERNRGGKELAEDASPAELSRHVEGGHDFDSPFVSASRNPEMAEVFARLSQGWIYAIRSNRGIASEGRMKRDPSAEARGLELKARYEEEMLLPAGILPDEVIGAWTLENGEPGQFIANPAYHGPVPPPPRT